MDGLDTIYARMDNETLKDLLLAALLKNALQPDASDFLQVAFALGNKLQERGVDPLPLFGSFQHLSESLAAKG